MPKRKPNPTATRLIAAVADAARGAGRRRLQTRHGLPERLSRAISQAGLGRDEFHQLLTEELRNAARETLHSFMEDLHAGRVAPATKPIMMGICIDKEQALEGRAALKSISVDVLINDFGPQSRQEVLDRLTGKVFDLPPAGGGHAVLLPAGAGATQPIPAPA